MDVPKFDYDVADEVAKRLGEYFKGLPKENVQAAFEELIDDYMMANFGLSILHEMRKVKLPSKGQCITTQVLAKGRAVLISSYGFKVKVQEECGKCGCAYLVLDENTRQDAEAERSSY